MTASLRDDARLAEHLVHEAGELAARMRDGGLTSQAKTSVADLVTAADHAAEELVVGLLAEHRPDDGVLGEEGAVRAGISGRTWVIDPVDGTYNFVQGLTWWCSAIALATGEGLEVPLLGAVYHPHEDTAYVGGPGVPATADGVSLEPLVDRPLAQSCVATYLHPPFFGGAVADAFARAVTGAATIRMLGSGTLDAMAVATGRLHVVCQHSVPAWDRLPGEAMIRSVGGTSVRVRAAGVEWYVAGVPTAVAEVVAGLRSG
ncbi:MAG: inositol monophosphatase family protein [Nocardioides sp.]|nr:inositol monophosphatase family protein [Nocardioides sp.]